MNTATILICIILIALFVLAIRFVMKNGSCAGCVEKENCHCTKAGHDDSAGCGGNCTGHRS